MTSLFPYPKFLLPDARARLCLANGDCPPQDSTLLYTFFQPYLSLSLTLYAIWGGISLHEIAHVAAAAAPAGSDALAMALLAKLGRVFLLIPLSFILSFWMRRQGSSGERQAASFPWFLLGFIASSIIGTYLPIPQSVLDDISKLASFLLAAGMVSLGLNVLLSSLRNRALRPLLAMLVASITSLRLVIRRRGMINI